MTSISPNRLDELRIEITAQCNLACGYCYLAAEKNRKRYTLSAKIFYDALSASLDLGLHTVSFTGGEPLLVTPLLIRFISECTSAGLDTGILTNATLLTLDRADQLCDAGLKWARISVDVDPSEIHVQKRIKRRFNNVIKAIKLFTERDIPIILRPTVTRHNIHSLSKLVQFAYDQRVTRVEFQPYMPCGVNSVDNAYLLDIRTQFTALEELLLLRRKWHDKLHICLYSGLFEFLSPNYGGEEIYKSRCGRRFLYLDSTGKYKTCAMARLILLDTHISHLSIRHAWEEHPYLLNLRDMTSSGICEECEWFSICHHSWCPAVNTIYGLPVNAPSPLCPKVISSKDTEYVPFRKEEVHHEFST